MERTARLLALSGLLAGSAAAHDGGFYDSFGVQGREQLGFATDLGIATGFVSFVDVAVQPDGKIVVSASVANGSSDIGVLRLNPNGTLDTNFGTQGQVIVPFDGGGSNEDIASSVLLQPNGRIVVCGQASGDPNAGGTDFGIVRLTAAGALDTQFSGDGKATVAFDLGPVGGRNDFAVRCSLDAEGRILVAGQAGTDTSNDGRMAVARLNSDGSRDTSFNGSGTATVDFGPSYSQTTAFSVKSLGDGGTLLVGGALGTAASWALAKLDANGQLDATFGNGGIDLFDPGFASYVSYEAIDAVALPDGSIIAVGAFALLPGLTNIDAGIFKLHANGSLDTSYGAGGGQIVPFDLGSEGTDIGVKAVLDGEGRLLVVGFSSTESAYTSTVVRLKADGAFDPTFGNGGKLVVASAPPPASDLGDQGTSIALTPDGGVLVGSIATGPSNTLIGLAKLRADTIFEGGFDE